MNTKFPVDAAKMAAKVDYPVVNTVCANGTATWQIAAPAAFMDDAMINKILALAGNDSKIVESAVFNADAAAADFRNKSVRTLIVEGNAALPADPAREVAELLISGGDDFFTVD